jgi:signal transduction histidine kinase
MTMAGASRRARSGPVRRKGLKHIAERVRILNGTLQINSTATGTAIEVLIPIPGDK